MVRSSRWTRRLLAALPVFGLGAPSVANALEYHLIAVDQEEAHLIDKDSIRVLGGHPRGWVLTVYKVPEKLIDEPVGFMSMLIEADCEKDRIRKLSLKSRDLNGDHIFGYDVPAGELTWQYVEPGTNGQTMLRALCAPDTIDLPLPAASLTELRRAMIAADGDD